jgi:hypothetical protein
MIMTRGVGVGSCTSHRGEVAWCSVVAAQG